jgi:hypothetical protein
MAGRDGKLQYAYLRIVSIVLVYAYVRCVWTVLDFACRQCLQAAGSSARDPALFFRCCHAEQHALPNWLPSECQQGTAVTLAAFVCSYAAWQCSVL